MMKKVQNCCIVNHLFMLMLCGDIMRDVVLLQRINHDDLKLTLASDGIEHASLIAVDMKETSSSD